MAIPLIPFVAGAVIGGLTAYLYKDDKVRKDIKKTAGDMSHRVSEGFSELKGKVTGKGREAPAAEPKATVKKKASAKKKVAKKKVAKKAAAKKTEAAESAG